MSDAVSEFDEHGRGEKRQRAFVVHPHIRGIEASREPDSALAEALSLAEALPGIDPQGGVVVRLAKAHPGTLFGSGKLEELKAQFERDEISLVLIDGPVSPVQQRNLEKALGVKLLDRTGLILEIFADRARTREGVLQVELAALSYQRTRLVRAWTHLERQRGGLGFVGGPGETQIEADRRAIDLQMVRLRRQLEKVVKTRELHRAARRRVPYPIIALVGYTNAGKSTLFNSMTGADVMAKDMLFATLDPTMRSLTLKGGLQVILSDTVGFISNLPTQLVAAFRATLEEVLEADLILHVRDIAHPETDAQAADVEQILADLGVDQSVARLDVWNKMDLLAQDDALHSIAQRRDDVIPVSALNATGLDDLSEAIRVAIGDERSEATIQIGHIEGKARAYAFAEGIVSNEVMTDDGATLTVTWSARQKARFESLLVAPLSE